MLKNIQQWLSNPKRSYHTGLAYFKRFATPSQKTDFLEYLSSISDDETVDQFDGRFGVLINQLIFIERRIRSNPELFAEASATVEVAQPGKKPSSGKISLDDLPESFAADRQRLKELVPLMAKLHADMANAVADDARFELVKQLVALDDERTAIWRRIDDYAAGSDISVDVPDDEASVRESALVLGAKLSKQRVQLQQNITRTEKSIRSHEKSGKTKLAESARKRLAAYKEELEKLEKLLDR